MSKQVKKSAIHHHFVIEQLEDKSITISVKDGNTKAILREVSSEVNFEYADEWNTQTFGSKLIDFLNGESDKE